MNDNPTSTELVSRMLQSCKNIIFSTSNLNSPEDITKDTYALENTDICLSIILETRNSLLMDVRAQLVDIDWDKIQLIIQTIRKQHKTDEDYCKGLHAYKNDLPMLKAKLEAHLAHARLNAQK